MIRQGRAPFFINTSVLEKHEHEVGHNPILHSIVQASVMGYEEVELPLLDSKSSLYRVLNKSIKDNSLTPVHTLSVQDFNFDRDLKEKVAEGCSFKVLIYQPLTPSFLERLNDFENNLENFKFVIIVRKDWNFFDVFKSIPHKIRGQLYVDFPVKLQPDDPFYESDEIAAIIRKLKQHFPNFELKSYNPHSQLYDRLLNLTEVRSFNYQPCQNQSPKLTLICHDPLVLENYLSLKLEGLDLEILFVSENRKFDDAEVHPFLSRLQVDFVEGQFDQGLARSLLYNLAAGKSRGEFLLFADEFSEEVLLQSFQVFDKQLHLEMASSGHLMMKREKFLKMGGFDPLFAFFQFEDKALLFKYLKSMSESSLVKLVDSWKNDVAFKSFQNNFAIRLLYHQSLDSEPLHQLISVNSTPEEKSKLTKPILTRQQKYLWVRFTDAYMSLFKWTPTVFIEANIKFLWSFIKPYVLKFLHLFKHYIPPFYRGIKNFISHIVNTSAYKTYNFVVFKVYHQIKMLFILLMRLITFLRYQIPRFFRWVSNSIKHIFLTMWYVAYNFIVFKIYHSIKMIFIHLWNFIIFTIPHVYTTIFLHFFIHIIPPYFRSFVINTRETLIAIKNIYYRPSVFKTFAPMRKVYFFTNYQYEKRVLGLHKSKEGVSND